PCGLPAATDLPRRPARRLRSGPARPAPERSARPTRRPTRPAPASAAQPPCQLQTLMILSAGATAPASRITASPTKFQTVPLPELFEIGFLCLDRGRLKLVGPLHPETMLGDATMHRVSGYRLPGRPVTAPSTVTFPSLTPTVTPPAILRRRRR